ncbi:hypothetical protein [Prosthecobacter sp.]|uniref:hypothetical protein n=1 Tax=Prosthecobacter sp. TaxID=1965333 RepID=UPI0024889A5B|nr:hypothetical protein [Prosthecobacter sp.]MDI1310643.1 hypothetical protein [Prosthecobacter sp.]
MKRRFPSALAGVLSFVCATLLAVGQTPVPQASPLTREQKEAAAAIEVPKTGVTPPPPGEGQNGAAAKPAVEQPPAAPAVSDNSASKMQVLEAVTQKPGLKEVPRVASPSDKIPVTSSTSTSRQFIVHGKVFETRSAMATRCEEISEEVRKVLNDKEAWVLPIVVLLNTGEEAAKSKGPPISTAISELSFGGFHLQVTINEGPGLKKEDLRKEIVRALLAERILRNHQKIETPEGRLLLPDWVMTGVLHALDYRASPTPSAMFATLFHSGKIYGIEEIIEASPVEMDNLSRTIYETSCCALVLALVDQPSGPQNLNKFLNVLASDPRSERELLSATFPNFAASASSLNKWWSLQLAALAKPGVGEPLTPAESLKAIEEAITLHYEVLPAAVPKNVKLHPFVLPAPLQVVAASETSEPHTPPHTASAPAKPKTKDSAAEVKEEPAEEDPKEKRSLIRRMLFLGDAKDSEAKAGDKPADEKEPPAEEEKKPGFMGRLFGAGSDEKQTPDEPSVKESTAKVAEKPAAPAPPATVEKEKTVEEEKKPGFMGRLFGAGSEEKKPEDTPDVTATADKKAPEKEKPATLKKPKVSVKQEPEAKEEPPEEKKPTKLNPMNWFRGGKKPAEEKKEETPAKEKAAFLTPPATLDVARLISPLMADAWQMLAPAAARPTAEPLFGFRKSKPKAEEAPKEEPPAQKAEEDRPPVRKSSKPRATNRNSKPAAKPSATSADKPRTTNPNAKPATPEQIKASAAATPTPGAAPALVQVNLPLEEYQHILKLPDRAKILAYNTASLRALELRVSILYRPVVRGYLVAVHDIEAGRTKDMDKRLAALHEFALIAYQKSIAVRDYLDWFEASESGRLSGKFDDFLNLPATIQKELPPRTDPISKYLDAIDKEFTK